VARTVRDWVVPNRPPAEAEQLLGVWLTENGFTIVDPRADGSEKKIAHWDGDTIFRPKPGSLVATQVRTGGAMIVFELTVVPSGSSSAIHFEGYTTGRGPGWKGKEYEFVSSALAMAGVPRKHGMELLAGLEKWVARPVVAQSTLPLAPPPVLGSPSSAAPPTPAELERTVAQQMIFVYMVLIGGIALAGELVAIALTSHSLNLGALAGGGFGAAICFGGAYYIRRGIRTRIAEIRAGKTSRPEVTLPTEPPSVADPGFCPACGASNSLGATSCVACRASLATRDTFRLEPSRTESDIRRIQLMSGGMAAFLLGLLIWLLSPLTRPGRDFEAAVLGRTSFANAPTATFILILFGPMVAWIGWQALSVRRNSGSGKLILEPMGVTVFDDSRHRFHLLWADPGFSMVLQDTFGNPMFTRPTIFLRAPKKGGGAALFSRRALAALEAAAQAHGLALAERTEQMYGAGAVKVVTISASVLPVFTGAFPRPG
jgi:hypothetical protein